MAICFDPADPRNLTENQRTDELAALLALGVHRVMSLRADGVSPSFVCPEANFSIPLNSAANALELSADSRLHGHRR